MSRPLPKNTIPLTRETVQHSLQNLFDAAQAKQTPFIFPAEEEKIGCLQQYITLLSKWNKAMNLVGPYSWQDMLALLVADSFFLAPFINTLSLPEHPSCWDLGAGAGLPGIPLRMVWSRGSYALVDAREKRALFLRTVLASCPLPGVTVHQARAEQFMPKHAPADLIVSRAFMPWKKLLGFISPYIRPEGYAVFLALEELPHDLPSGWIGTGECRYSLGDEYRYFWSIRRQAL